MNLNSGYHVGIPSVNYGNRQFFDKDNFAAGKQANFESSNEVLVNNPRPPCFQQEEPSLFHESYKVESSKLLNLDQVGLVSQSDKSILKSEYDRELLSTYFYAKNKELGGLDIPQLPLVLETSSCKETYVNLTSNAYVNNEYETMHLGKQNLLTSECEIHAVVKSGLSVNASISDERVTKIGDGLSPNMHAQSKPITGGLNPAISEKIWDGSLKLNTSTTVSTVAFFKSGEKLQDLNWPDHVEIKGKVRLQAFEKFIQELPRSRNRALMVISLCGKVESSGAGLEGMMEIAKGYQESEKVGFAQITPGFDLYVCPRSDIIITILAKYGFFKGMTAVEEDQSSLIGCVVWRRSQPSSNPASKSSEEKKNSNQVKSDGLSIQGMNSTAMEASELKKKQVKASATDQELALDLPASESGSSISPTDVTESKLTTSTKNLDEPSVSYYGSVQTVPTSIAYSSLLVPAQQNTSLWSSLNLLQESMKQAGIPLAHYLGTDKSIVVSDSSMTSVLPNQSAALSFDGNSYSSNASENHGKFVSCPVSGPRPLIPVDSSNFQFQPQLIQMARSNLGDGNTGKDSTRDGEQNELLSSFQSTSSVLPGLLSLPAELLQNLVQFNSNFYNLRDGENGNDSKCSGEERKTLPSSRAENPVLPASPPPAELLQRLIRSGKNVPNSEEGNIANDFTFRRSQNKTLPTFQESKHVLPRPPPLPAELQKRLIQSNKNVPKPLNERIQETEVHFLHQLVTRGPADNLEIRSSSLPQRQKTCGGSNDDEDLPEFDFDSACGLSALTGLKERAKPLRFHSKLSTTSEPLSLTDHLEEFSPERPPIQASKLTRRSRCMDRAMELGGELRHGIGSSSKSRWDNDDDDDMPEWCPPDAELPEQPLLSTRPGLRSQRSLSNPATTASPSFRSLQSRDLQQRSQRGLLGACPNPTTDAPAAATPQSRLATKAVRSGFKRRPEPPFASHERKTSRSPTTRFDRRRSPYDFDKRQRRR
ncbi:hypothetical protein HPP92_010309 [Vanilla planifolia]|uniref:Spen paralogue and orthologue SPOC C-terminal domain-containing protein n=1 Tax=Vanilla planifolia TaxID=51239 RepID=A0A835QYQ7_VANPL|nr:hypothetical protein HPP92_010309 [Vanilla planifolia]